MAYRRHGDGRVADRQPRAVPGGAHRRPPLDKVPAPDKPQKFRQWFQRYGLVTVFIPAVVPFIPLPLKVFVVSAGVLHTGLAQFLAVMLRRASPAISARPIWE